jgi:integrase
MAEIFKPVFYVDPATNKRVTSTFPGAIRKKSPTWWIRYYTPAGNRLKVKGYTDKKATETKAAELERHAIRVDSGLVGPDDHHANTPLLDHLTAYVTHLKCEGRGLEHIGKTVARIKAILDGCGFVFTKDLNAEKLAKFLHKLRQDRRRPELPTGKFWFSPREMINAVGGQRPSQLARFLRRERLEVDGNGKKRRYPRPTVEAIQAQYCRGIGISTSNGYLAAIRAFSNWLVTSDRTGRDRLVSVSALNAETDPRHGRRALNVDELRRLLGAAASRTFAFQGLSGPDRSMLYATAMGTGFRASELASLFPYSFDLSGAPPTVTVKAGYTKNKKKAEQPISPEVAKALSSYLDAKPRDRAVWPGSWRKDAAEMLRLDLAAAGIPYRDEAGHVADFHALRHAYITLLGRNGVSPKTAQELARHSDYKLTMKVYTHVGLDDLAGAVNGLPSVLPTETTSDAVRATGTDGRVLGPFLGPRPAISVDFERQAETNAGEMPPRAALGNNAVSCVLSENCETTRPGFEPGQREPKSLVLPLHYRVLPSVTSRYGAARNRIVPSQFICFAEFGQVGLQGAGARMRPIMPP